MRHRVMTRIRTAVGAGLLAVVLAGCAATGTAATSSTSSSGAASSSAGATSSLPASASSVPPAAPSSVSVSSSSPVVPVPVDPTTPALPAESSTSESTPASSESPADGAAGWFDTWGWVSPQTAERALAAGIAAGKDVRDELRCGTACGESPTATEIQAQYLADHPDTPNASVAAYEAAAAACPGYFIRGNCYADAQAALDAGEGE